MGSVLSLTIARHGRWIVTWEPLERQKDRWIAASWGPWGTPGAHDRPAGPVDRDFGGSGTSSGPMVRDFLARWGLLGTHNRSAGPMDRGFLASRVALGAFSSSLRSTI